jgi:chemotaxis protein methyltransferase CheR
MNTQVMDDAELVSFLQWCLPQLGLRWAGFRKVRGTVRKRLTRRIRQLGLTNLATYRRRLEADPWEWSTLEIMCRIPISRFYRDRAVFDFLAGKALPELASQARFRKGRTLSVLSCGCASGEEPYTISMIWAVRLADAWPEISLQILALDIDDTMLQRAAMGCYGAGSLKDLPPDLRTRGFELRNGLCCLREAFRSCVSLQKADIRQGVPDGPFDLILCRNTAFTYFEDSAQRSTFADLNARLRTGGYMVIGAHEALPVPASGYQQAESALPIYRKRSVGARRSVEI